VHMYVEEWVTNEMGFPEDMTFGKDDIWRT
jgi:hypothetical protein